MTGTSARVVAAPRMPAPPIQRKCACGAKRDDECPECKATRIQRLPAGTASAHPRVVPPTVNEVISALGRPLDPPARTWFEQRLGRDFSDVRVHVDDAAAESARALNAVAYTSGPHIVFARGQYAAHTERGRRLLAHELTHVVQQRAGLSLRGVSAPGDAAEREAEKNADRLSSTGVLTFDAGSSAVSRQATATEPESPAPCTPEQQRAIDPALERARSWLNTATSAVSDYADDPGANETTRRSLVRHFRSADAEVVSTVQTNIESILSELERLIELQQPGGGFTRFPSFSTECATDADPDCEGTLAFVQGTRLIFCPGFIEDPSLESRAGTLIHEVSHTLVGLDIEDRAYRGDRLLEFLSREEAVDNAESYEMFVKELGTGHVVTGTPPRDDIEECTPAVSRLVREALGRAERWNGDAVEEAEHTGPATIRFNTPIFARHLGSGDAATRAAAARVFRAAERKLASAISVVCDSEAAEQCSASHRAYGKKATSNLGLGAGIGAAIGGGLGIIGGLAAGFGLAGSVSTGAAVGAGLAIGGLITLLGTFIGLAVGAATSSGPSIHVCPTWKDLAPFARAESMLAAAYEVFTDLNVEHSRKHAALAHDLHDAAIGPAPAIEDLTP